MLARNLTQKIGLRVAHSCGFAGKKSSVFNPSLCVCANLSAVPRAKTQKQDNKDVDGGRVWSSQPALKRPLQKLQPLAGQSTEVKGQLPPEQSEKTTQEGVEESSVERLVEKEAAEGDKTSLAIFDKDGTLICFHSMWTPWALQTAQRIETATGLESVDIAGEVFRLLDFCPVEQKVQPGMLAEATMPEIKGKLVQLLVHHDMELHEAEEVVNSIWEDCNTAHPDHLKALHDLKNLFSVLRSHGVKVAICTADSRAGTVGAIKRLGLWDLVDVVVCGDDSGAKPKPHPHNALKICEALGVNPEEAYMVGDTMADVGMGNRANLGGTIGVLSGVAKAQDLEPHADHVVESVGHILPILLKKDQKEAGKESKDGSSGSVGTKDATGHYCPEEKIISAEFFKKEASQLPKSSLGGSSKAKGGKK